jgi:replicative DNA helicase Mcm
MDDWLEFLGYWIADGCLTVKKRTKKTILTCQKDRKVRRYGDVLSRLGFNPKRNNNDFVVYNLTLWEHLLDLNIGAGHKYLPDYVWNLSERQSRILLNAMVFGDGNAGSNQACVMYYTSSTRLADDVMRLALHCGWAGNKIFRKPAGTEWNIDRSGVTNFDSWYVTIVKNKLTPQVNQTQNGQSERIIEYSGSVHCIEVPNHVFYVRQNGKGVWSGNSTTAQKSTIGSMMNQEDMPFSCSTGMVPDLILNPCAIPS